MSKGKNALPNHRRNRRHANRRSLIRFGAEVSLTSPKHPSGTDRIAEVAARLRGFRHIINVQGDEPALDPRLIDRLVRALQHDSKLKMVTAASPFETETDALNPNNVKVVTALDDRALYFSRSLIPFDRDNSQLSTRNPQPLWHIGIYGYRRDFLMRFVRWRPTPLERTEKLEQLRALEHGATIQVVRTRHRALGVDTPEDVPRAEKALAPKNGLDVDRTLEGYEIAPFNVGTKPSAQSFQERHSSPPQRSVPRRFRSLPIVRSSIHSRA